MTRNFLHRRDGGFSLIEVMVAVAVLAFGLLALAALQSTLIRTSAETKAQSVGLAMAKDAVEEMRSYQALAGYQAIDTRTEANAEQLSMGGVNYRRWWTVSRYAYDPTLNTFVNVPGNIGATPTGYDSNNEFKRVQVNVAWTDATGATRSTSLEDALAALDPADSAKLAKLGAGMTPRKPKVIIWNPSNTEGVIPLAIGGGSQTAATNPTPEVVGRNAGNARVIETRFDVLTYAALSGNRALAQARVETVVAGCQCDAVATTEKGFRPTFWDGERYVVPQPVANNAPARAATNLTVSQSPLCTICCRDHHDPSGVTGARFSPRRTSHAHYAQDAVEATTNGMETTLALATGQSAVTSGRYAEACRIIRVDGFQRVAADAYANRVDLIQTNSDTAGNVQGLPSLPRATADAVPASTYNYAGPDGFVLGYLNTRFITPGSGTSEAIYNDLTRGGSPAPGALHPVVIMPAGSPNPMLKSDVIARWGHSRGLYIDYLEAIAVSRLNAAKDACNAKNGVLAGSCDIANTVLSMLPFTSINLTELAEWRAFRQTVRVTGSTDKPSYSIEDPYLEDENYDHLFTANNDFISSFDATNVNAPPVRGAVEVGYKVPHLTWSGNTSTQVVVAPRIRSEIYQSNSGLAVLASPINMDETIRAATQDFRMDSGNPDATSGSYKIVIPTGSDKYTFADSTSAYPKFSSSPITSRCSYATKNSGGNKKPNPFTCVARGLPGNVEISMSRYNYQTSGSVTGISCQGNDGDKLHPASPTGAICVNYGVSSATINPLRSITVTQPLTGEGSMNETTRIDVVGLTSADQITVNMVKQTSTPATCTYEMVGTTPVFTTSCP